MPGEEPRNPTTMQVQLGSRSSLQGGFSRALRVVKGPNNDDVPPPSRHVVVVVTVSSRAKRVEPSGQLAEHVLQCLAPPRPASPHTELALSTYTWVF